VSTYLEDHPPRIRQYRQPRRATPSGLIVVHTAESVMDVVGPDTGAENVAAFIAGRTTYGSYHLLVDSDSIVQLVPFNAEAYGDATGSNPYAIHLSFACSTTDWNRMAPAKQLAFIRNGARAAARAARWLRDEHGVEVPPMRVSREESERRQPGFISHAGRDVARRTDPGLDFPWPQFLGEFVAASPGPRVGPSVSAVNKAIRAADAARLGRIVARLKKIRRDLRAKKKG
jgi:hypothetical protein